MTRPADDGVTLVLPCLNEAESIEACIVEAQQAMAATDIPFEVIVVDNGSTDGSDVLAAQAGARVVYETVPGYGSAVRRGIAEAVTPVVVMADADCTYDLSRLPDLVTPVRAGRADMVLGERLRSATGGGTMPLLHRLVGTPVLSWLARRAAPGLTISDSQSGYRAFRRDAIDALRLRGTGMEFASEMLIRGAQSGLRITEIPTQYRPRVGESKLSTLRDGMRHLRLIMLLSPHLLLRAPGVALLLAGMAIALAGLLSPDGLPLGDGLWQPVFLSTILVTVGALAAVAGSAVKRFSPLAAVPPAQRSERRELRNLDTLAVTGAIAALAGLALDLALLVADGGLDGRQSGERLAVAGLATSAIIVGSIVFVTGLIGRLILAQTSYLRAPLAEPLRGLPGDDTIRPEADPVL